MEIKRLGHFLLAPKQLSNVSLNQTPLMFYLEAGFKNLLNPLATLLQKSVSSVGLDTRRVLELEGFPGPLTLRLSLL